MMSDLSAETFPDDSILANLSQNLTTPNRSNSSASIKLLETQPIASWLPSITADNQQTISEPTTNSEFRKEPLLTTTAIHHLANNNNEPENVCNKQLVNNGTNRPKVVGAALKRSSLPLAIKSASVDGLHNVVPSNFSVASSKKHQSLTTLSSGSGSFKKLNQRRYDHVQSKVKVDIDNAREHDNRRRSSKFQRHQSMPETLYRQENINEDTRKSTSPDSGTLVVNLREQLQARDRQIAQKDMLIMQLYSADEQEKQEKENLRLQQKIETMRMEIMEVKHQNLKYQEEMRELTAKAVANGFGCAVSSSAGTNTDSSAGSSYHKHTFHSSSSGVSSASVGFLSDDRYLLHRKPHSRPVDCERSPTAMLIDGDDGIVLFDDKTQIDECPVITSSSTPNELLELFHEAETATDDIRGKRALRRKRAVAKSLRKRLRQVVRFCTPCLDKAKDLDRFDGDTSLLYGELQQSTLPSNNNHQYNSFN